MINYRMFNLTNDHSFNVFNAIKYCIENNEDGLAFDKGEYHFYAERSFEDVMYVSNHDIYGIYRIVFLVKNMKNFTIDGGGSKFVFHDSVIPFYINNSANVCLKNFSIDYDETMTLDTEVVDLGSEYFDVKVCNDEKYCISDSMLYFYDTAGNKDVFHYFGIRSMNEDKNFIPESKDVFRVFKPEIHFEDLGDKKIRVYDSGLDVQKGMHLITRGTLRYACNIVISQSKDISVSNIIMYRSYAMGILAQKTENVFIDKITVEAKEDSLFSLNCDATHFVHCKGLVSVTNCRFSEQQDDALNIHGIFTRITDKTDEYILVKYMHRSAKGLSIYEKGSEIAIIDPKTLIPTQKCVIDKVEEVNMNYTKLYLNGGTEGIEIGQDVEDLTWSCDLIFENNYVVNNRARGILIAAKGKVTIKNNYFNTPGVAILFESDGEKWFESGGTTYVDIEDNTFDNCRYTKGNWGNNVIEVKPREQVEEGKYYHEYINISNNKFINCDGSLLYADNIKKIVFKDNITETAMKATKASFINCGEIIKD